MARKYMILFPDYTYLEKLGPCKLKVQPGVKFACLRVSRNLFILLLLIRVIHRFFM